MRNKSVLYLTQAAMIAALYVVLTYIANMLGLASQAIQVRFSEALTILPAFTGAAVPGLFIGCILANILTNCAPWDVVFGSIATLLGALGTYFIAHPSKDGMNTYFTKGIWWMAGKDIEVGHWDSTASAAVISDEDLVDITKDLFVGTGTGNKRKILLCGSDMLSAFSKIKSDKFRLKETVEVWNLKFKSWYTDFGEVLTIHHELFDINGMSDCGFAMDPEYLNKKTFVSWTRSVLDLKKAGVRNTDAAVIQEVSCLYLRYPKAHARMRLAQASETPEPVAVTGIELNHTTAAISTDGGTYELEATLSPEDAEGEIEWTSSDETIATVSDEGVVTAVGNGTAVIIAACNNKVATCTVTVSNQS